jgi:hypothetical protein
MAVFATYLLELLLINVSIAKNITRGLEPVFLKSEFKRRV